MNWRPNASLASLQAGATLRRAIRQWMDEEQVLEVCTALLSRYATTDPHVLSVQTNNSRYLHTSPEFAMKRLLAAFAEDPIKSESASTPAQASQSAPPAPDLYQIAPVFRAEESGRFHNAEFTLLEWYRLGMDHRQLMRDTERLLQRVWQVFEKDWPGLQICCYGEEVHSRLGEWPENLCVADIRVYFDDARRELPKIIGDDVDAALDLFMDEFVLPDFCGNSFTFLTDYPVSQAALSRLGKDENGRDIAQRFEVYYGRIELANGFHELKDATIQRQRFEEDLQKRDALEIARVPMDEHLLEALSAGLPDCAGIALGLDRLQMVLGKHEHIDQVLSFNDARA